MKKSTVTFLELLVMLGLAAIFVAITVLVINAVK